MTIRSSKSQLRPAMPAERNTLACSGCKQHGVLAGNAGVAGDAQLGT